MEDVSFVQDLAFILLTAGLTAWLFRSLGLSSVVGCILAGILIGPHAVFLPAVSDVSRVETLAQIGLVFLMFWIGLGFSLQKLRRLGAHILLANMVGALLLFYLFRAIGQSIGWSPTASVFLAGMSMVSSSAIIAKTLAEAGVKHEKSAQRALTITLGEDAVVIMLLTLLASYIQHDGSNVMSLPATLGVLGLFVILFLIGGLLFVPRILLWLRKNTDSETLAVLVTGTVFLFALISLKAGYSLALGAFLLGAITADTPVRNQIERMLSGAYFILSALFFTAIGMLINPAELQKIWLSILVLSVLIMFFRILAYSLGLLVIGNRFKDALKTSLYLTPIGEFSFIIASLGVSAGVLTKETYALAVGICFVTALTSPLLARHAEHISIYSDHLLPAFLKSLLKTYQKALHWLKERHDGNLLWKLCRPRLWQLARELSVISGLLIFAAPFYRFLIGYEPFRILPAQLMFWSYSVFVALLVSLPLLALWRNFAAMSLLFAETLTRGLPNRRHLSLYLDLAFRLSGLLLIGTWILFLLPWGRAAVYSVLIWIGLLIAILFVFQRRLILWHSRFELLLDESVSPSSGSHASWMQLHHPIEELNLDLVEVEIPDQTPHAGKNLAELNIRKSWGATIAGIERQGWLISAPGPSEKIYPNDRILLLGTPDSILSARSYLQNKSTEHTQGSEFNEIGLEQILLEEGSPFVGKTLEELNLASQFHLTVVGLRRNGATRLNMGPEEKLQEGDSLLVLASPGHFSNLKLYQTKAQTGQERKIK